MLSLWIKLERTYDTIHKNGQIAGYYVLYETKSTAIKKIHINIEKA